MTTIWVVEDNPKIQAHVVSLLREEDNYDVTGFPSAEAVMIRAEQERPQLLLLDIRLKGMSGLELIHKWSSGPLPPIIVVSGEATISEALEAMRMGVQDFIEKPFSDERLIYAVRNCLEKISLQEKVAQLEQQLVRGQTLIGDAPATQRILAFIEKVAPTNSRVLITGESGVGKELVASAIHYGSKRRNRPFVKINCAAFPANLIEDELFGHVRGAFTDARGDKQGLFEEAHGGTLFLDEIGDMDYNLQARLLRVLEDGKVRRIGDKRERQVDVRVLAATNKDLETMVGEESFREDLFYRLANIPIQVPPLRERREDIPLLLTWFVNHFCRSQQLPRKEISPEVMEQLSNYRWPGNVRELKNLAERLVIFGDDPIQKESLPPHIFKEENRIQADPLQMDHLPPMPLKTFKAHCERAYIQAMLIRADWNYVKVAEQLEINRSYLHQKITALGIQRK